MKNIVIGADHAGFELKEYLKNRLTEQKYLVNDLGTYSSSSVDYPDFAHPVARAVESDSNTLGILICGSANGVSITANKHAGIRAALCWREEIATLARQHNDANILCLPARYLSQQEAGKIVAQFLSTPFEGGRHKDRVLKISC